MLPKGTKLYSPLYGECTFLYIADRSSNNSYPIVCETVDDLGMIGMQIKY